MFLHVQSSRVGGPEYVFDSLSSQWYTEEEEESSLFDHISYNIQHSETCTLGHVLMVGETRVSRGNQCKHRENSGAVEGVSAD